MRRCLLQLVAAHVCGTRSWADPGLHTHSRPLPPVCIPPVRTEELKPQIVPVVHQLLALNPGSTLHITGHSLGAAMAVLSAAHIQTQENISVAELYTFGLPRVGDTAFSKWFHQAVPQAIHVTHYHDIVPHLPPQWLFGYHHTPTEVRSAPGPGGPSSAREALLWWMRGGVQWLCIHCLRCLLSNDLVVGAVQLGRNRCGTMPKRGLTTTRWAQMLGGHASLSRAAAHCALVPCMRRCVTWRGRLHVCWRWRVSLAGV